MSQYAPQIVATLATEEPVSATELRTHSRIDFTNDDTDLEFWIATAREMIEASLGRAITLKQLRWYPDSFPAGGDAPIVLPWATPLVSVESLTFTDSSLTSETWTANASDLILGSPGTVKAHVNTASEPGCLVPPYGSFWPFTTLKSANPIQIDYTAGYASTAATPKRIKQAIRLVVGHWYANREAVVLGKAVAVDSKRLQLGVDDVLRNFEGFNF